jgi:putative ABC transport system permease protein
VALCLRNTFRRKGRIALTLATLTFAGALFIMAMSVPASFDNTIEALLNSFRYDVMVVFPHPRRAEHLIGASASVPGVTAVEVWDRRDAELVLASTSSTRLGVGVYGVPPHSQVFNPHIASGRSLLPDDGRAILLNKNIAADHDIQVGDEVTLKMAGKETTWTVVGLILNATVGQSDNFVPFDTLTQAAGSPSQGSIVMLASEGHDAQAQARLIGALSNVYAERGIETTTFQSASQAQEKGRTFFGAILYLLLTMVIVAAIVGSLGLTGTLSINVVERRREIGVMRALGAKPSAIATIFVTEGMLVGALSWLFAAPLSYPGARVFSDAVGNAALGTRLDFSYPFGGIILWLVVVLVLSVLASLWPAVGASRVSVREVLAYE